MEYKVIQPSAMLRPYVRHFWILDILPEDLPYSQHIIPYGRLELFFYLDQPSIVGSELTKHIKRDDGIYSGFFKESIHLKHLTPFRAVGVSLQPWAGNMLFKIPANQFSNRSTSFLDLDPDSYLREHLIMAKNEHEIVLRFEEYFKSKLQKSQLDEMAAYVSRQILLNSLDQNIHKAVLPQIGLSKRRIEQRFLAATGVSMGFFSSITRFERAVEMMLPGRQIPLTQVGLDAGYYDQSHFIREFKRFSDFTPSAFVASIATKEGAELDFIVD